MGEPLYSLDWKSIRQGDLLDGRMTWQHGRCGDTDGVMVWCGRQLYKIEPLVFAAWMKVLKKVKNAKLWLLKFTEQGAQNLLKSAKKLKVDLLLCMPFLTMCYFWCTPVQAHARTHTRTHTYTHTHTHTHINTHTLSLSHTHEAHCSLLRWLSFLTGDAVRSSSNALLHNSTNRSILLALSSMNSSQGVLPRPRLALCLSALRMHVLRAPLCCHARVHEWCMRACTRARARTRAHTHTHTHMQGARI